MSLLFYHFRPKPCPDPAAVVGRWLLETSDAINVSSISESNIATWSYPKFPLVDNMCNFHVANLLDVRIDLETKKMVTASLDEVVLTSEETLILLIFKAYSHSHPKVHSMANWGVNIHQEHKAKNPFHARNSIVTIIYNYMGFTKFEQFIPIWIRMGLLSKVWEGFSMQQIFQHGVDGGVQSHTLVRELAKYSKLVSFVTTIRSIFLEEFLRHKRYFPGCDGEAMFVGTVLHSLDHTMYERILEDPFWVDVNCERYV